MFVEAFFLWFERHSSQSRPPVLNSPIVSHSLVARNYCSAPEFRSLCPYRKAFFTHFLSDCYLLLFFSLASFLNPSKHTTTQAAKGHTEHNTGNGLGQFSFAPVYTFYRRVFSSINSLLIHNCNTAALRLRPSASLPAVETQLGSGESLVRTDKTRARLCRRCFRVPIWAICCSHNKRQYRHWLTGFLTHHLSLSTDIASLRVL